MGLKAPPSFIFTVIMLVKNEEIMYYKINKLLKEV